MTSDFPNIPVFFYAALFTNSLYVLSFLSMGARLRKVRGATIAEGAASPPDYDGGMSDPVGMLRFLFSKQHQALADSKLSQAVFTTRCLFCCALVATLCLFAWAASLMFDAPGVAQ